MDENKREPKRLLVLTSSTGAGHDTHAYATAAWCERLYGSDVEVIVEHLLEDSHLFYRRAVDFYNFIQRRAPWFHHVYYNVIELLEFLNPGTVSLGRDYYIRLLQQERPHAILSVMDCLSRGYFELAKSVLGPEVKCATYCTEFSAGYGFSRNWVNPRGDYFFARTKETSVAARHYGMAAECAVIVGHWAPPAFHLPTPSAVVKASYLKDTLGLEPNRFTLLLSTGGAGAQNHAAILRTLFPLGKRIQVIALCGRNARAQAGLDRWAAREAPFAVKTIPFTDEVAMLMRVSSAVVARAGATTAGEALLCNCPMIFNALGLMMPQELPTWRYFRARDIGFAAYRPRDVRDIVERWLDRPEELTRLRERMAEARCETTPQAALELLLA